MSFNLKFKKIQDVLVDYYFKTSFKTQQLNKTKKLTLKLSFQIFINVNFESTRRNGKSLSFAKNPRYGFDMK